MYSLKDYCDVRNIHQGKQSSRRTSRGKESLNQTGGRKGGQRSVLVERAWRSRHKGQHAHLVLSPTRPKVELLTWTLNEGKLQLTLRLSPLPSLPFHDIPHPQEMKRKYNFLNSLLLLSIYYAVELRVGKYILPYLVIFLSHYPFTKIFLTLSLTVSLPSLYSSL